MEHIEMGPWGGSGGRAWSYNPRATIKEIVISYGDVVDSLTFVHENQNGIHFSDKFGGGGGGIHKIQLSPGEYLTNISGTIRKHKGVEVVGSLQFHTNLTTYGAFGKPEGTSFGIAMRGAEIVGFNGRSGNYLDSIGIFVKHSRT